MSNTYKYSFCLIRISSSFSPPHHTLATWCGSRSPNTRFAVSCMFYSFICQGIKTRQFLSIAKIKGNVYTMFREILDFE